MANSIVQTIREAEIDARSLSEFIYNPADAMVSRRLAPSIHTLNYYLRFFDGAVSSATADAKEIERQLLTAQQQALGTVSYIENTIRSAIDTTVIENSPVSDALISVDGSLSQRTINKGLESVADLLTIKNPKDGLRVYVKSYHAGLGIGGGSFEYNSSKSTLNDGGTVFNGWVRDYSGVNESSIFDFGAKTNEDVSTVIQDFYAFLRKNKMQGVIDGEFNITAPVDIDASYTNIRYNAVFTTVNNSDYAIKINHRGAMSTGIFSVVCGKNSLSLSDYNQRRQNDAVIIFNARESKVCDIKAFGSKRNGIMLLGTGGSGNSNMCTVGSLRTYACGLRHGAITKTPEKVIQVGSAFSLTQRSILEFSEIPDTLMPEDFIICNNAPYLITDIDAGNVTVFPQLKTENPLPCDFVIGCGTYISGADANVINIDLIDSVNGGVGAKISSFYGPSVNRVHVGSGYIGVAVMSGNSPISSSLGGRIGYLYTEGLPIDILQTTIAAKNWIVETGFRDPLINETLSQLIPKAIDTQHKSVSSNVIFAGLSLQSGQRRSIGMMEVYESKYITNNADYILLAEKKSGGETFSGTIYMRGHLGSSAGQSQSKVEVNIAQTKSGAYTAFFNAQSDKKINLCTLTYNGKSWFAIDCTKFGLIEGSYFIGVQDRTSDKITSIAANLATDVKPITYGSTQTQKLGELEISLDAKYLILKSGNGTAYKITVSDSGQLLATNM